MVVVVGEEGRGGKEEEEKEKEEEKRGGICVSGGEITILPFPLCPLPFALYPLPGRCTRRSRRRCRTYSGGLTGSTQGAVQVDDPRP